MLAAAAGSSQWQVAMQLFSEMPKASNSGILVGMMVIMVVTTIPELWHDVSKCKNAIHKRITTRLNDGYDHFMDGILRYTNG